MTVFQEPPSELKQVKGIQPSFDYPTSPEVIESKKKRKSLGKKFLGIVFIILVSYIIYSKTQTYINYYELLNVPKKATRQEILIAYSKKVMGKSVSTDHKEKLIIATKTLLDYDKRRLYDKYGAKENFNCQMFSLVFISTFMLIKIIRLAIKSKCQNNQ
eukprot:gene2752-4160_t